MSEIRKTEKLAKYERRLERLCGTHRLHPVWPFDITAASDDRRAIFSETSCLVDQVNCCNYLGDPL